MRHGQPVQAPACIAVCLVVFALAKCIVHFGVVGGEFDDELPVIGDTFVNTSASCHVEAEPHAVKPLEYLFLHKADIF